MIRSQLFFRSRRNTAPKSLRGQIGSMLIEALVASVIFTIGVLALIKLQAEAVRQTTEAKGRSDASYLADKVLGDLAAQDLQTGAQLATFNFSLASPLRTTPVSANATIASWQTMMGRALPNAGLSIVIEQSADPLNPTSSVSAASVTVTWQMAGGAPRTFTQVGRLVD